MWGELVTIDGSKFQAVASKHKVVSRKKMERQVGVLEEDIARYLMELEASDATEERETAPDTQALWAMLARFAV